MGDFVNPTIRVEVSPEADTNKSKAEMRVILKDICDAMQDIVGQEGLQDRLDDGDKENVDKAVHDTQEWLNHYPDAYKNDIKIKQKELKDKVNKIIDKALPLSEAIQDAWDWLDQDV